MYAAMNHFKSCIPMTLPPLGMVGVCHTFERIVNEPAGISNDFSLSFEFGQFSPVVFRKRVALDDEHSDNNSTRINCGKITEPDACISHSQCGWCTQSQLCLPDGGLERSLDMLGTCSRCGYFPGSDENSKSVGFAEQCKYRPGCGLCRDARQGRGAALIQSFNCMAGDKMAAKISARLCLDEARVARPLMPMPTIQIAGTR